MRARSSVHHRLPFVPAKGRAWLSPITRNDSCFPHSFRQRLCHPICRHLPQSPAANPTPSRPPPPPPNSPRQTNRYLCGPPLPARPAPDDRKYRLLCRLAFYCQVLAQEGVLALTSGLPVTVPGKPATPLYRRSRTPTPTLIPTQTLSQKTTAHRRLPIS